MLQKFTQFVNESVNSQMTRFKASIEEQLSDVKRIMVSHFPSIIGVAMNKSGLKAVTQEMVNIFQDVVNDKVFGGVEPEEWSESWYDFWDKMDTSYFLYANEADRQKMSTGYRIIGGRTPYQDKNHPYMSYSENLIELFSKDGPYSDIANMTLPIMY